jgi:UDP-glucose 4-epimerase
MPQDGCARLSSSPLLAGSGKWKLMARVVLSPAENDTFNIGTGRGITSNEVINLITHHFDLLEIPVLSQNRRLGDIECSLLSMKKFAQVYGMRCDTSLEEGLRKYAALEATT